MANTNPGPATTTAGLNSIPFGNAQQIAMLSVPLTPATVAANTTAEQTFTVSGLLAGDMVELTKPTNQAGLGIVNARVSAANTLAVTFVNAGAVVQFSAALTPAAVAANTTAEQTFAVTGVAVGDIVSVNKPTAQAGLGIVGARVSAANTLAITFSNNTAASITPTAAETYLVGAIRSAAITPTAAESYQLCVIRPIASALSGGLPSALPLP